MRADLRTDLRGNVSVGFVFLCLRTFWTQLTGRCVTYAGNFIMGNDFRFDWRPIVESLEKF